jgi:predicted nucleic acid-binding protein
MNFIFVDTLYWIALTNPKDQWHQKAVEFRESHLSTQFVTTEVVLIEYLNYYSSYGSKLREVSSQVVRAIMSDRTIEIVPQSQDLFFSGLNLYEQRLDKGYSMVDCISMSVMRDRNLLEVLTHDRHFAQEGFRILL